MRFSDIYSKVYYRVFRNGYFFKKANLPPAFAGKKNLFIYFDYEREFGGYNTSLKNSHIYMILDLLDKYDFKSTWFTVGKIFEKYPETIDEIGIKGHEIASHTYYHIIPLESSRKDIYFDFERFYQSTTGKAEVKGFHSPCGLWNLTSISMLSKYQYNYEVISCPKNLNPYVYVARFIKHKIYRFCTIGDDWGLVDSKFSGRDTLSYFMQLYNRLKTNYIAGIGFHPWVLFSNDHYFKGFDEFLNIISQDKTINIRPVNHFLSQIVEK